eukprot:CAMPEP_0117053424 /NCGR_PEP_ID=MMETSP0472-20121206/36941_1 /TAXON_ID=693140 ORGANISM="Tiarina fusus, Strain LIS" /NCGR_SAMPLE_ID=MMETSP0472 /ASSEMBLY_ACC=CAM_ASM_000603 /LENGTH=225 /DNA_ID=CAMNT_0004768453 /DNA_START=235 /DNA_END=909 /DNA_ORIENTATION=+
MATLIQSAFRTYSTRKKYIIPNLRRLQEVESKIHRAGEKFSNVLSNNPSLSGEKLRLTYAEYEEALTKGLLELDSVSTKGVDIVRDRRKNIVITINAELAKIDAKKPEIMSSVFRERKEKEEAIAQSQSTEAVASSQSNSECDDDCDGINGDIDDFENMEIDSRDTEMESVHSTDNCENLESSVNDTEIEEFEIVSDPVLIELEAEEEALRQEKEKLDKMLECWE